jgi:ATP-dependent protease ClpP protease subunit
MNKRRRELLNALMSACAAPLVKTMEREPKLDRPGLAVRNEDGARELMIYGRIGGGGWFDEGIGASDVAAALRELGPGPVDVRINSGGGDVFDGVAIHSLLARHQGTVTTHIDGLAASAASFIAMAGDRIVMARNGFMMIHDGMTMTYGNGNTHRGSADLLDKISDTIADMYAERAGEDVAYWRNLMTVNGEDGTWYSGQEALEAGLVDEITGGEDDAPDARLLAGWSNLLPERIVAQLPEPKPNGVDCSACGEHWDTEQLAQECCAPEPAPEDTVEDDDTFAFSMSMWHYLNSGPGAPAKEGQ